MAKAFVARQQIQNKNGKIVGYELLFRGQDGYVGVITSNLLATSKVLLNILTHMDFKEVIGEGRKAFINIDHDVLFSGTLSVLEPEYFVIEILETTKVSDKLLKLLQKLKERGFEIALDDFDCTKETYNKYKPIFKYIDFVKFDMKLVDRKTALKFMEHFKKDKKIILAEKIENLEEYNQALKDGYDLFQGFYFKRPEVIEVDVPAETSKSTVLQIIALLKNGKEIDEIESFAKMQPDLVHNLLKYLNSPTMNIKEKISSLKHAMNLLGRDKLLRWMLIYIYADAAGDPIASTLLKTAMERASLMEKMATQGDKDRAFLTGMFSLLDVLFDMPMDVVLRGVPLENSITSAIKTRSGELGSLLVKIEDEEKVRLKEIVDSNFKKLKTPDVLRMLRNSGINITSI